jgi:hypothetical protein
MPLTLQVEANPLTGPARAAVEAAGTPVPLQYDVAVEASCTPSAIVLVHDGQELPTKVVKTCKNSHFVLCRFSGAASLILVWSSVLCLFACLQAYCSILSHNFALPPLCTWPDMHGLCTWGSCVDVCVFAGLSLDMGGRFHSGCATTPLQWLTGCIRCPASAVNHSVYSV